jgi:hypothetical protein
MSELHLGIRAQAGTGLSALTCGMSVWYYMSVVIPCNLGDRPQSIHDPAVTGCIQGKQDNICFPFSVRQIVQKSRKR